ncbi:hypothetical protein ABZW30_35180 [Kitasatospora sp. NPDC004669]
MIVDWKQPVNPVVDRLLRFSSRPPTHTRKLSMSEVVLVKPLVDMTLT